MHTFCVTESGILSSTNAYILQDRAGSSQGSNAYILPHRAGSSQGKNVYIVPHRAGKLFSAKINAETPPITDATNQAVAEGEDAAATVVPPVAPSTSIEVRRRLTQTIGDMLARPADGACQRRYSTSSSAALTALALHRVNGTHRVRVHVAANEG